MRPADPNLQTRSHVLPWVAPRVETYGFIWEAHLTFGHRTFCCRRAMIVTQPNREAVHRGVTRLHFFHPPLLKTQRSSHQVCADYLVSHTTIFRE